MSASNLQTEYWAEMQSIRTHAYYLALYQESSEATERNVSIALAVASSSSIGAWVVWKDYAMVWSLFIAATQVLSVAYKFLPFKARIKPLGTASVDMAILADDAERHWHQVRSGALTGSEVNDKRFDLRARSAEIMRPFSAISLPENDNLMEKAKRKTEQYISGIYKE